eukprot:CAMPEP_0181191608 /NCGR_PEP_ID=MMETSP1096-20121128/12827_1 /TAXON_ID=156174 ORGANISM="Chrysochromulina ericina, Strain CCMP281" /NCGR_SAMPLE_ID=MMETSP1096 /ASSEMBLY_ACC=CAM_ASM_000453 /LENGTH=48 /DNA_ID= /DNA_START= /DNA_END= /DNA_ORIENTATION=
MKMITYITQMAKIMVPCSNLVLGLSDLRETIQPLPSSSTNSVNITSAT